MQTRKQKSWAIAILVVMVALAVGFTAYVTKDQWDPSATDSTAYDSSGGQSYGGGNNQSYGSGNTQAAPADNGQAAATDNGQAATDGNGQGSGAGQSGLSRRGNRANGAANNESAAPAQSDSVSSTVAAGSNAPAGDNSSSAPAQAAAGQSIASAPAITHTATITDIAAANVLTAGSSPTSNYVLTGVVDTPAGAITTQPAVVGASGALLLDAPNGKLVASLATGTLLDAVAGSADQTWVKVQGGADPNQNNGWVAASQLLLADVTTLPVVNTATGNPVTGTVPANLLVPAGNQVAATQGNAATQTAAQAPAAQTAGGQTSGQTPAVQATINSGASSLHVRSAPGTNAAIIASANNGQQYTVVARNSDNSWLEINTNISNVAYGWVSAAYVTVTGDLNSLPVAGS